MVIASIFQGDNNTKTTNTRLAQRERTDMAFYVSDEMVFHLLHENL